MELDGRLSNGFLSSLSAGDLELIRPFLRSVELVQESVLAETGEVHKWAYLPHQGIISLVVTLAGGEQVHVAMVGHDSIFDPLAALGDQTALNRAVVLVPGIASTIEIDRVRMVADRSVTFRSALNRHGMAVSAQIQQAAGCNASHSVESRLARCLLQTYDMSGCGKFLLTQESMAHMIGARRNSVSLVAHTLQQSGFIHYSRGHIEIIDLEGLSQTSCGCYATVKAQYERLVRPANLAADNPAGQ